MSVSAEIAVRQRLSAAVAARAALRKAVVDFMNEALFQGWSWSRIANALSVTDVAARRYYERNKRKI